MTSYFHQILKTAMIMEIYAMAVKITKDIAVSVAGEDADIAAIQKQVDGAEKASAKLLSDFQKKRGYKKSKK